MGQQNGQKQARSLSFLLSLFHWRQNYQAPVGQLKVISEAAHLKTQEMGSQGIVILIPPIPGDFWNDSEPGFPLFTSPFAVLPKIGWRVEPGVPGALTLVG